MATMTLTGADEVQAYDAQRSRRHAAKMAQGPGVRRTWENGSVKHMKVRQPNALTTATLTVLGALGRGLRGAWRLVPWAVYALGEIFYRLGGGGSLKPSSSPSLAPGGPVVGLAQTFGSMMLGSDENTRRAHRARRLERLHEAREWFRTGMLLTLTLTFLAVAVRGVLLVWGIA